MYRARRILTSFHQHNLKQMYTKHEQNVNCIISITERVTHFGGYLIIVGSILGYCWEHSVKLMQFSN